MTFSTKSNPKLPQSTAGITSLGAVGGARGTAAGGLRIFVEFFTTYDPKAVKQLESDIARLDKTAGQQAGKDDTRLRRAATVRRELAAIDLIRTKRVDAATRKLWKLEDGLQGARTKSDKALRATTHAQLEAKLKASGLNAVEIAHIQNRYALQKRQVTLQRQIDSAERRVSDRSKKRLETEGQLTRMQQIKANLGPKLAGLAIGAIGGILGGAILNVGWQLADEAIAKVGEKIQDLIDPARHAKENVKALGDAVNDLANSQNIQQLTAAKKIVEQMGISPTSDRGVQLSQLLNELAIRKQIMDSLEQQIQLQDILDHKAGVDAELRKKVTEEIILAAKANGTYTESARNLYNTRGPSAQQGIYINGVALEAAVTEELARLTDNLTDQQYDLAQATERAAQAAANSSALWEGYAQSLSDAISASLALQTAPIDNQIAALGDGESARTRSLQAQLERASGGGSGQAQTLRNLAEERALLLLKMRLKLLGTNINLEKYSGKFLLVAIEAKIAALQKEGDAQERVNQLLDLQYRMGQTIGRNEGESIADYLERRAKEQRDLLQEQDDFQRQTQINALEDKKSNLEDQLALEELAERKRQALREAGVAAHTKALQKQLAASQEADKKALEKKKAALEKQKAALEQAAKEAIALTSESAQKQTLAAINGMKTVEDVGKFSGRLSGLMRAKSSIQALVEGYGLPKWVAAPFLEKLNGLIGAASARSDAIYRNTLGHGTNQGFAKGGVFMLKNSSTPFGQNVRTGEEGSEIGIVLSRNVAKILQAQKPGVGQIGPITINKSTDPYRDAYTLRRAVQAGLEAAVR